MSTNQHTACERHERGSLNGRPIARVRDVSGFERDSASNKTWVRTKSRVARKNFYKRLIRELSLVRL